MSDIIRRADAIEAVCDKCDDNKAEHYPNCKEIQNCAEVKALSALPSAEGGDAETNPIPTGTGVMIQSPNNGADLISRELAMERIANDNVSGGMERINEYNNSTEWNEYLDGISDAITTIFCDVPSADITETETCQKCQESIERVLLNKASAEAEPKAEPKDKEYHYYKHIAVDALKALPSADAVSREEYERLEALYDAVRIYDSSDDAVEVVRCKDCKYRYMDGEVTHYYWCRLHDRPVDDTDYCAWGEESEVEE